jgi:hypothetical protein
MLGCATKRGSSLESLLIAERTRCDFCHIGR